MANSDVSAVKVYNYICGMGGFAEFSQLLRPPSPLAKKSDANLVMLWFQTEKKSGSFDSDHHLLMTTNQNGQGFGIRVDLKKQMCLKYATTDSCKSAKRCKFWHICKEFIEGTCKGGCGRSHNFHDEDNKGKTAELGFEQKSNTNIKSIVAGSSLQVCHSYLKNECVTNDCPYLHICVSQVRATPCECLLSHNFSDSHNKNILEQYGFKPPRTSEIDVVRCNVLVPKQQKPIEDNKRLLEFRFVRHGEMMKPQVKTTWSSSQQTAVSSGKTEMFGTGKSKIPSKVKVRDKPVTLSGLIQQAGKSAEMAGASPTSQQGTVTIEADPVLDKVFNFICGKGGLATLSDLLQHPSPLAKKFSAPGQEMDLKIWLQVQAQPDQNPRISLLENEDGEVCGARVNLKKKICLQYTSNGSCTRTPCWFWHICKGYLQGKCSGDCGLSHDFHDEGNVKNVQKLGLEKIPNGALRNIVANSLPQVCLMYLNNKCLSESCPYLHICSHPILTAQGISWECNCSLSHDLEDDHNMGILKQYELVPQPSKLNIVHCNILIPNKQKSFVADKTNLGSSLSPLPQTHLNKFGAEVPSLMSLQITQQNISGPQQQDSRKSSEKKKGKRQRTRKRNRKTNQQEEPTEESQGSCANSKVFGEESSDDSVSDNEDIKKPDLYTTSKFAVNPVEQELTRNASAPKQTFKGQRSQFLEGSSHKDHTLGMDVNQSLEENLISLSDDDWQGPDAAVDDLFSNDLLSQVDEIFFDDWFGPSNAASSLSQGSAFSSSSDQNTNSSEGTHSDKSAAKSIFRCICMEYNGQVPFSVISQRQELFPPDIIDVSAWFKANPNQFMTIENKAGVIEAIRAYNPKARICFRYLLTKKGCKDPKCFRYHVCSLYLANGVCPFGEKCSYSHSHSLLSPHNKKITRQLRLNSFSEEQLRILISASVPEVCLDYNKRSCQRGFRCNGIHICMHFVKKKCKKGENCPLGHSLETPEAKLVLGRYNLSKVPSYAVLGALLIRQQPSTGKTTKDPTTGPATRTCKREVSCQPRYICLDNLLGHCSKEPLCDHYHCSAPYMWQYKDPCGDEDTWKAFTANENEDIERQFCNVNITVAEMKHIMISTPPSLLIDPGDGEIQIHFDDMKAVTSFGDVQLRRLSTKSAVLPTDHALSTQWIWYWMDESNIWKEYEPLGAVKDVHKQIESMFTSGKPFFKFEVDDDVHKIFFRKSPMCQQNTKPPITAKRVSRRPVFRSTSETQELQRPLELPIPLKPESHLTTGAPGRLPSQWTSVPESEEYNRVPLSVSSDQYKLAESLFRQTMSENKATIVAIEQVQNPFMWEKYARKKEQLEKRFRTKNIPVNEKLLFHGTDHQSVDTICEENIDWRALDEGRAAAFGEGAYFTEKSDLSNLYCKQDSESMRYMFLAEVLVGSFAKGEPSMKRPPYKTDSTSKKELYDSCVDCVDKPTIFVLFDSDQYYPSFLIQYKIKSKVVC